MIRFIFVSCCLAVFSISIFGQNLNADLRNSFNKYSIVEIDNQDALKRAKNQIPFKFDVDGKTFQFILIPNEIRSEKYTAEYTNILGVHSLPRSELFTYTGTLIGEKDSAVAFTVDGTKTEGLFLIGDEKYYLESASKYSLFAGSNLKVIYRTEDKVKKEDFVCGLDETIAGQLEETKASLMSLTNSPQWSGTKILQLATEADYQWVQQFGYDPQAANNYILSTLNAVDVIYRRDLKIAIYVTFQHAWTYPDPYPTNGAVNTLASFKNYWIANYSGVPRNTAHLFTGKYFNLGYAYQSVVCSNFSLSYGLSGYVTYGSYLQQLETAHEIGHNLGAYHNDTSSCYDTIMNAQLSTYVNPYFCAISIEQITDFITAHNCLLDEITPDPPRTLFDFDADGKADISVFRPSNNTWYIQPLNTSFYGVQFGDATTDKLAPADYDGDGKTDIAVYRSSNGFWYLQRSAAGFIGIQFGDPNDIPQPADFDGDGKAEIAVWRPSNGFWYVYNLATNQFSTYQLGASTDKPVVGDYDGDAKADYAVFSPSNGFWYLQRSAAGFTSTQFGDANDKLVPADYDGDGKTDVAVWRPSNGTWYLLQSTNGFYAVQFGQSGDIPGPADYDGDGKADISVFRPGVSGVWYRINSSTNSLVGISFGQTGDVPVPSFNIVQ